jgi:hypothetical protein
VGREEKNKIGAMLQYAWQTLTSRGSLWLPALGCALLAAVPGALAGTVFAAPVVAFVLTGNPLLALSLLPDGFTGGAAATVAWIGVGVTLLAALCVWSRFYAAAVWISDPSKEPGFAAALRETRDRWRAVAGVYVQSGLLLVCVLVPAAALAFAAGGVSTGGAALLLVAVALGARTLIRITATLAIRATVLDTADSRSAWRQAVGVMKKRRGDTAAVWIGLVAIGAAVWMGGRLISPILQDTAFDYPAGSSYAALRELAQVILAVPLEAFLLVFSIGAWTAVYRGIDSRPAPRTNRPQNNPWVARAAALLLILTIVANGIPTAIDARYSEARAGDVAAIIGREINAEETLRPAPSLPPSSTSYDVVARIDGEQLTWTTKISYRNDTRKHLEDLGLHIYAGAFDRALPDMPMAGDLLAGDFSGSFRAEAESGRLDIERVLVDGVDADRQTNETSMVVDLPRPLKVGSTVNVTVSLSAELPAWPERYGVWEGTTLLGNWVPVLAVRSGNKWLLDEYGPVGDPFFSETADYRVSIEAADNQRITGTGSLTKIEQTSSDTRTWMFEAPATRDVAYAVAPYLRALQTESGGIVVRSWYPPDSRSLGSANLRTAASAVADYSRRFGTLPFDEVDVVATSGLLGGMEYPGVVFVAHGQTALEGVPVLPELLEFGGFDDAQRRYVIGHELAHQWWYASVGNDQVREPWLDEALAEVSTITWLKNIEGDDRTWRMTNLRTEPPPSDGRVFDGVESFQNNRDYTDAIYLSGAKALLDLRASIGAQRFDAALHAYHTDNQLGVATADDFIDAVRRAGGAAAAESFQSD